MKTISCLFFIVLIFVLWPHRTVSAGGDLIDKACEKTPYKELCKSSLRREDESPGADLHNLARIAVNVAWTNATDTQEYMNTLLHTTTEPFMQQSLQDCDATYDDAIGNLEGSDSAFESKGYDDIMSWLGAAMIDPQTCEDYFKELPGHSSPLTSRNEMLVQLCSNALALTKLVANGNGNGKDL